jgi:hypothetical protein
LNPYVSFALAMCVIVFLALVGTAYLAVVFNRRAKGDLEAALTPLAEVIDGEVNLDDALVKGRYQGHIAEGRMATSFAGPGRVFHTLIIDAAGGAGWQWTLAKPKQPGETPEPTFAGDDPVLDDTLGPALGDTLMPLATRATWEQFDYDPASGFVRRTVPMQTRRDLPHADQFTRQLDTLIKVANLNRQIQHPEP